MRGQEIENFYIMLQKEKLQISNST